MKYIITFVTLILSINICFSQEEIPSLLEFNVEDQLDSCQNFNTPKKACIMDSRNTWSYADNDSVLLLLNLDSIKSYSHIKNNILIPIDSIHIFEHKWDTINIFSHSYMNFKEALDTVVIPLFANDSSKFSIPLLDTNKVYSCFGWRKGRLHSGVDLKLKTGDSVLSVFDGVVRYARWNRGGYGNLVIIRHTNGLETFYAHLSKISCKTNQVVRAGELIGLGGNTGRSLGAHLHFEIRHRDTPFNPESIIDFEKGELKSEILYFIPDSFRKINNKIIANADFHIINNGDTLWLISRKYGISLKHLCSLNGIKESSILRIGQKIKLR